MATNTKALVGSVQSLPAANTTRASNKPSVSTHVQRIWRDKSQGRLQEAGFYVSFRDEEGGGKQVFVPGAAQGENEKYAITTFCCRLQD